MLPAGVWSTESARRFALQLEGERWANACPPLTPRSRRARTKPLTTDRPPAAFDIEGFPPCLVLVIDSIRPSRTGRRDTISNQGRQVESLTGVLMRQILRP